MHFELMNPDPWWWFILSEEQKATRRWKTNNRMMYEAGCRCGRPSTHVVYDFDVMGWVPRETWSCEDHVGVSQWFSNDGIHWEPQDKDEP